MPRCLLVGFALLVATVPWRAAHAHAVRAHVVAGPVEAELVVLSVARAIRGLVGLARRHLPLPLVLAGGLDEHNVGAAIALLRPSAVDVSGGVEQAPGRKDAEKIKRFVAAVRAADALVEGTADDD